MLEGKGVCGRRAENRRRRNRGNTGVRLEAPMSAESHLVDWILVQDDETWIDIPEQFSPQY